jgi:hypothetical protein
MHQIHPAGFTIHSATHAAREDGAEQQWDKVTRGAGVGLAWPAITGEGPLANAKSASPNSAGLGSGAKTSSPTDPAHRSNRSWAAVARQLQIGGQRHPRRETPGCNVAARLHCGRQGSP